MKILKNGVANIVTNRMPSLLFYLANRALRDGLSLQTARDRIDIVDRNGLRQIRISRKNAVYLVDMINSFDYYFSSAVPISIVSGSKKYRVVDFSTPRFHEVSGFADFPIMCPSLTEPFVTAQQYLDFAGLKPGAVVVDLGSYSGLTSIAFSKEVGASGRVIALEPDPINFAAAQINIALHIRINQLSNIVNMNSAVSSTKSLLQFSSEGSMGSAETSIVGNFRGNTIKVNTLRLRDVVDIHALDRVDFIKMDIEGSEEQVLESSREFFLRFKPKIIVEPHVVNGKLSEKKIISILSEYGYTCATIPQSGVSLPLVTGLPSS